MRLGLTATLFAAACTTLEPPTINGELSARLDPRASALVTLNGDHPWLPPDSLDEWSERREEALLQLRIAVGLEPMPPKPPLKSSQQLIAERDDYSVFALRVESLPGHWVTGNLYLPKGEGPFPAVLCPHGHWPDGRFTDRADLVERELESGGESDPVAARYHLQARCVQLARMGCLVIHYDMVGYADSTAISHTEGLTSAAAQLWGVSHLGLQTWNSLRMVDHLVERRDVDSTRIGITGGSGGGTQSFLLAAIDERIRAAFPAVMVSTEMQGGCVCENGPYLRLGTSNIGISALIAPRALGMTGADDWTLHIEERGLPELKQVWSLYDRADAVEAKCFPQFGHNYNAHGRARMYAFMARHLQLESATTESSFEAIPPAQLSVYADSPRPEERDAPGVFTWWHEQLEGSLAALKLRDRESLEAWKSEVSETLGVLLHTSLPETVDVLDRRRLSISSGRAEALTLSRVESDEAVRALWVEPSSWRGAVRVIASSTTFTEHLGVEAWEELLRDAHANNGDALLFVDVLGVDGSLGARFDDSRSGYEGYTTGYNRSLIAERVHDLLTAIAHARGRVESGQVHLVGLSRAGPWAILAAALSKDSLASLVANRSWEFADLRDARHPDFLPGALRLGDMTGISAACAPLKIKFTDSRPISSLLNDAWTAAGVPPPRVAR
jgi:cephalosporin-C deacetylase-like acetyl esterase